uniref:Odorant receptor n=1 Tax=Phlebotomus papatasi TaxID=29031 RepID=A0A3F2ZEM2_PHLPP
MLKLSSSFDLQIKTMTLFGFWNPGKNSWYFWYSIFMWTVFVFFFYFFQVIFIFKASKFSDISAGLYFLVSALFCIIKLIHLKINRSRFEKLFAILDSSLFQPQSPEELAVLKKAQWRAKWLTHILYACCPVTGFFYAILPFLGNRENIKIFLAAWYPWTIDNPINFAFTYLFELIGLYVDMAYAIPCDTIIYCLFILINGQIECLGVRLKELGYVKPDIFINTIKDQEKIKIDKYSNELSIRKGSVFYGEIVKCIILHKKILEFVGELQEIYNNIIFFQFVVSTTIFCMTGYEILMLKSQSNIDLITRLSYIVTVLVELFLLCLTGNEIIYTSRTLNDYLFSCNFQNFDKPTVNALKIFMTMTNKDIVLKGNSFMTVELSLNAFMQIVKLSYTFFTFLKSMEL